MRDAACYVCWSFARAYEPKELEPFVNQIARYPFLSLPGIIALKMFWLNKDVLEFRGKVMCWKLRMPENMDFMAFIYIHIKH